MEPAGTERHRWAGRRPSERERPSQTPHNLAILKYCQFALGADLLSSAPVQNLTAPHSLTDASRLAHRHFPARVALSVLFLAALWFGLCKELSSEWSVNEQYNFGWFVPFFALYLFWLRWQDRPATEVRGQKSEVRSRTLIAAAIAIISLLLLFPVRLFEIANPEWRLLAWIHALAVVTSGGQEGKRGFAISLFPSHFFSLRFPGLQCWRLRSSRG